MKSNLMSALLLALVCAMQSGCLLTHSIHSVVRQDEPLRPLMFESERAKKLFEGNVKDAASDDSNEGNASFAIPFIVGLEKSTKLSGNAIRNDVATRMDLNGDRHISDYEASLPMR